MCFMKIFVLVFVFVVVLVVLVVVKDFNSVGILVGLLGNFFFVVMIKGIEDVVKKINFDVKVILVLVDYDLNK